METHTLTRAESATLNKLEDVLTTARRWAVEEAQALVQIRDARLYRDRYRTFEEYAEQRWGYDKSYLYRLCQWGQAVANLSPTGNFPQRESQARPLYGLSPDQQRAAWRLASRHKSLTAAVVEEAVAAVTKKAVPSPTPNSTMATGTVVCADAFGPKGLASLTEDSVDLLLTSLPYCEQRKAHYPSIPEAEYPEWVCRLLEAVRPKLTPRGNVLLIAREHLRDGQISDVWLRTRLALRERGWTECETLVWSKPDAPPLGRNDRPRRAYEFVYWFARTPAPYADVTACGHPPVERRDRMRRDRLNVAHGKQLFTRFRSLEKTRITDVIVAPVGGGIPQGIAHPAVFPLSLALQLVQTFCPPGGLVADPCAGSGTTLVAARDAGRRYWGCDIVPTYVKTAQTRLATPMTKRRL